MQGVWESVRLLSSGSITNLNIIGVNKYQRKILLGFKFAEKFIQNYEIKA